MEKLENQTLYRCDKCGEVFTLESCCKHHEENCDGEKRGKLAANELNDLIYDITNERRIEILAGNMQINGACYDVERKRIVLVAF